MLRSVDIERQLERGRILLKMTSCDSFDSILVLSLRELMLTKVFKHLVRCTNLQILFLAGNRIQPSDVLSHMHKLKTVQKLDLSNNEVYDLPTEPAFFASMKALQFLVLDHNAIQMPQALKGLRNAPSLKYLSLQDNPIKISLQQTYRFEIASLLPDLHGLDRNAVTFDEKTYRLNNRSVRFCSMNSFSRLSPQMTLVFLPELSAAEHLALLEDQLQNLTLHWRSNDPLRFIKKSLKEAGIAKIAFQLKAKMSSAVIVIQKHARGMLTRMNQKKDFLNYFESIGELELTMTYEEEQYYRMWKTLKKRMPPFIAKWRGKVKLRKAQQVIARCFRGWVVRKQLRWLMHGPMNLSKNRHLIFLKEQKYLLKHILLEKQTSIPPPYAKQVIKLISDYKDFYLVKHIDLDLFTMPRPAALQVTMPAKILNAAPAKLKPKLLTNKGSIFELCVLSTKDESTLKKNFEDLQRLKQPFKNLSTYELKVGQLKVIPEDQKRNILRKQTMMDDRRRALAPDSLLMSSRDTEQKTSVTPSEYNTVQVAADDRDRQLFVNILRRECEDFVILDLNKSENVDINSEMIMNRLLKLLIKWNQHNEENQIHFYVGELFKRQVSVIQIQRWWRSVMRMNRQRKELHESFQQIKDPALKTQVNLKPNQLTIMRCLQLRRAAQIIQQYWSMYRLKRRIAMLKNLKVYLEGVTSNTLCIEEHLYRNIKSIQCTGHTLAESIEEVSQESKMIPRRVCNTIPEAHCFAFDFVEASEEEAAELGAWDLIYSSEDKHFVADTNRKTHNAIYKRFETQCVPDWVVHNNLELSKKVSFISSDDRNSTKSIFHKTQKAHPTEVLDYNQIVEPKHRSFVMNNGLRFVVIHCSSVEDARRRALALAMITLDRKKGDFLKIFCPNQIFTGTFMPNIKCWWELPTIKEQLPKDFYKELIKSGRQNLRELPLPVEYGHSGLILSQKHHYMAHMEPNQHSVQIQRQLNFCDLRMKLVYSGNKFSGRGTSSGTPSLLNLQMQHKGMAQSKMTSGALSSETLSHAPSYSQQQHVLFKVSQVQLQTPSNQDLVEEDQYATNHRLTSEGAAPPEIDVVGDSIAIEVQAFGESTEDQSSMHGFDKGRNTHESFQGLSTGKPTNMRSSPTGTYMNQIVTQDHNLLQDTDQTGAENTDEEIRLPSININSAVRRLDYQEKSESEKTSVATQTKAMKQPYMQQAQIAAKSMKTFNMSQIGVGKPRATTGKVDKDDFAQPQIGNQMSSIGTQTMQINQSGAIRAGGFQLSTTTRADSLGGRPEYTTTEGQNDSHRQLFQGSSAKVIHGARAQSGLGVRVKTSLQMQSAQGFDIGGVYSGTNDPVKVTVSQKLLGKRPQTSFSVVNQSIPPSGQRYQKSGQMSAQTVTDQSTLRELQSRDEIKTVDSIHRQDTFRIRSAIFRKKSQPGARSVTFTDKRMQEIEEFTRQKETDRQLISERNYDDQMNKSLNVQKQRMVNHLVQDSIKIEKQSRLKLIQKLSYAQKKVNQVQIASKQLKDLQTKNLATQQRVQSNYVNKAKRQQDKQQALRMTGAANMLNKITIDQIRDKERKKVLQLVQDRKRQNSMMALTRTSASKETVPLFEPSLQRASDTSMQQPYFNDIEPQMIQTYYNPSRSRQQDNTSTCSLRNPTNVGTQRLMDPLSRDDSKLQATVPTQNITIDSNYLHGLHKNVLVSKPQTQMMMITPDRQLEISNVHSHKETLLIGNQIASGQQTNLMPQQTDYDLVQQNFNLNTMSQQDLMHGSSILDPNFAGESNMSAQQLSSQRGHTQYGTDALSNAALNPRFDQSFSATPHILGSQNMVENYNPALHYGNEAHINNRIPIGFAIQDPQFMQHVAGLPPSYARIPTRPYTNQINRDIQSDMSRPNAQTGQTKKKHTEVETQRLTASSQRSEKQFVGSHVAALPVTMKEYQLHVQPQKKGRPKSGRNPNKKNASAMRLQRF